MGHSDFYFFKSKVVSYRLIIPKYDVHTLNIKSEMRYCGSLQDKRQNQWTMKYMPQ